MHLQMIALYQDPEGKRVFERHRTDTTQTTTTLAISSQVDKSRILALEKEIKTLQEQLNQQRTDAGRQKYVFCMQLCTYLCHWAYFNSGNFPLTRHLFSFLFIGKFLIFIVYRKHEILVTK